MPICTLSTSRILPRFTWSWAAFGRAAPAAFFSRMTPEVPSVSSGKCASPSEKPPLAERPLPPGALGGRGKQGGGGLGQHAAAKVASTLPFESCEEVQPGVWPGRGSQGIGGGGRTEGPGGSAQRGPREERRGRPPSCRWAERSLARDEATGAPSPLGALRSLLPSGKAGRDLQPRAGTRQVS